MSTPLDALVGSSRILSPTVSRPSSAPRIVTSLYAATCGIPERTLDGSLERGACGALGSARGLRVAGRVLALLDTAPPAVRPQAGDREALLAAATAPHQRKRASVPSEGQASMQQSKEGK